jgi:hypothetical protein
LKQVCLSQQPTQPLITLHCKIILKNYWFAEGVLHVFAFTAPALALIEQHAVVAVLAKVFTLTPPAPRHVALF